MLLIIPVKFVTLIRLAYHSPKRSSSSLLSTEWQLNFYCMIISLQPTISSPVLDHNCPWTLCSCHMASSFSPKYWNVKLSLFVLILFLKHQSIECPFFIYQSFTTHRNIRCFSRSLFQSSFFSKFLFIIYLAGIG